MTYFAAYAIGDYSSSLVAIPSQLGYRLMRSNELHVSQRATEALTPRRSLQSGRGKHIGRSRFLLSASLAVGAVLWVAALLLATRHEGAGFPARLIPASGAYFGSWVAPRDGESHADAITQVEDQIGRRFAIDHQYYHWDSIFPSPYEAWTVSQGRIPFLNWKAMRANGTPVPWAEIASGAQDATITARADAIKAFEAPLYVTFHHEPENDLARWGTPEDFAAAFRHIVEVFRSRDVDNVAFVWTMMSWTFDPRSDRDAETYYPGDGYVDLVGSDGYNFYPGKPDAKWETFAAVFEPTYDFALRHNKPWMAVEWGAQEDSGGPGSQGPVDRRCPGQGQDLNQSEGPHLLRRGQGWLFLDHRQLAYIDGLVRPDRGG